MNGLDENKSAIGDSLFSKDESVVCLDTDKQCRNILSELKEECVAHFMFIKDINKIINEKMVRKLKTDRYRFMDTSEGDSLYNCHIDTVLKELKKTHWTKCRIFPKSVAKRW